jgi:hypothetical protein
MQIERDYLKLSLRQKEPELEDLEYFKTIHIEKI